MEMKVQIPFQQLLELVKKLTPTQKAKLKKELEQDVEPAKTEDDFINYLLQGPVYAKKDVAIIEENSKSIASWRTKN